MARPTAMISLLISLLILLFCVQTFAADSKSVALDTQNKQISYALGFNIGNNVNRDYKIDLETFSKGFKDSQTGEGQMSNEEIRQHLTDFQNIMKQKQDEMRKVFIEKNRSEGEAFLAENKSKEGMVTLPSGLQYKVLIKGEGASPKATDSVTCHYRGTTIDGTEFDSSIKRGEPATFKVGGVIKGWTEALQLMTVGSKWMLYIPADLAYGDRGAGKTIEPGSTLVFEVELLSIEG